MSGELAMWVVYDHPIDFPVSWIARRWLVTSNGPVATADMLAADRLETIRAVMQENGLIRMTRDPDDDAKVVETWL